MLALALAALAAQAPAPPAAPTIPPATIDDQLEVTGDALRARNVLSRLFIETYVNDRGPFSFLVDSGADRSVIGTVLAARLALPPGPTVTVRGTAGSAAVPTARVESLRIGGSELFGFQMPTLSEEHLGGQGLLGIDALADQRLLLDFEKRRIVIQDSRQPEPRIGPASDEIVVTARRRNGQLILTQASVANVNLYAIVDSGTMVTVANSALRRRLFGTRPRVKSQKITLISVTGQTAEAEFTVVPSLRLGGITFENLPIAFADSPPFALFGLANRPAILLGTDVLSLFRRISLDFRARKVRFVLKH